MSANLAVVRYVLTVSESCLPRAPVEFCDSRARADAANMGAI